MLFFGKTINMKKHKFYFSSGEIAILLLSYSIIILSFVLFDNSGYMNLIASLIGVTSIILNAKGNPAGQLLIIIFSVLYGIISYSFSYYGEMITYLCMTAPMALFSLVSWLRHPYNGNRSEVSINTVPLREIPLIIMLTAAVTVAFYFILGALNTANLIPSTVSVTTSFLAAYLTFRRSKYFALAYFSNDIVLLVLWSMASVSEPKYLSVVICFAIFLVSDMYGFISWHRMYRARPASPPSPPNQSSPAAQSHGDTV